MPIEINSTTHVYRKSEVDALLYIKADKVGGAVNENIAGLTGTEGNLLDTGYNICDLQIGIAIDAGTF
jgi:hypothetical protein